MEFFNEQDMKYWRRQAEEGKAVIIEIPPELLLDLDINALSEAHGGTLSAEDIESWVETHQDEITAMAETGEKEQQELNTLERSMKKVTVMIALASVMMGLGALTGYADGLRGNASSQAYTGPDGRYYVDASYSVPVIPVYVFYNAYMRDFFWTTSDWEADQLEREFDEGEGYYCYNGIDGFAEESASDRNTPVYRFWNEKTSDHFYTTSEGGLHDLGIPSYIATRSMK